MLCSCTKEQDIFLGKKSTQGQTFAVARLPFSPIPSTTAAGMQEKVSKEPFYLFSGGQREVDSGRGAGEGEENKKKNNNKKKKRWQFDPVDCVSGTGTQTRPTRVSPRTGGRRKEPGMLQGLVYAN